MKYFLIRHYAIAGTDEVRVIINLDVSPTFNLYSVESENIMESLTYYLRSFLK
jgi:hypothetical protein